MRNICLLTTIMMIAIGQPLFASMTATVIPVGTFSKAKLDGWKEILQTGDSQFSLVTDEKMMVIKANSKNNSSIYYKEIEVSLIDTPVLNWSWKLTHPIFNNQKEQTEEGNDFAAQIYIFHEKGLMSWSNNTNLSYVWASTKAPGTSWENPSDGSNQIVAVQSGIEKQNTWVSEKRDVRTDYLDLFDSNIDHITGIAIVINTNNTQTEKAASLYGDIYFSAD